MAAYTLYPHPRDYTYLALNQLGINRIHRSGNLAINQKWQLFRALQILDAAIDAAAGAPTYTNIITELNRRGGGLSIQQKKSIAKWCVEVYNQTIDEMVTNGDMSADTDWTKGTGWDIDATTADKAHSDGTQVADADLTQAVSFIEGTVYKVVFTVSGYSAGNVTAVIGGTEGTDRAANGTFTEYIIAGSGSDLDIRADLDFIGDIDDVSVTTNTSFLFNQARGQLHAAGYTSTITRSLQIASNL